MKTHTNKYNLVELENCVNYHYNKSLKEDTDNAKVGFFKSVQDIAYAILHVSKYKVDYDEVSHDYATSMYERVFINGERFTTNTDRIPFTAYIRLNIRGIVFPKSNREVAYKDLLDDLKFVIDDRQSRETSLSHISNSESIDGLGKELHSALLKFYSQSDIEQKLGIALDMIFDTDFQPIPRGIPKDIQVFSITLICLAKRLSREHNLSKIQNRDIRTVSHALDASLRSSSFLALVADNPNHLPLLLSTDIDSLYRLATVAGGTRITIPSLRYLNNLTNASVVASSMIKDCSDNIRYKDISRISKDFNIKSSSGNDVSCSSLQKAVSKALDIYDTLGADEKSNPVIQTLGYSIAALDKLVDKMDTKCNDEVLKYLDEYSLTIDRIKKKLKESQSL